MNKVKLIAAFAAVAFAGAALAAPGVRMDGGAIAHRGTAGGEVKEVVDGRDCRGRPCQSHASSGT